MSSTSTAVKQGADAMTLDAYMEAMRRAQHASEDFICGYADGFTGTLVEGHWSVGYRRGVYAGEAARDRGAHRGPRLRRPGA